VNLVVDDVTGGETRHVTCTMTSRRRATATVVAQLSDWVKVRLPLDTKRVISETLFPANLLAGAEKIKSIPAETTTRKLYYRKDDRAMHRQKQTNSHTST